MLRIWAGEPRLSQRSKPLGRPRRSGSTPTREHSKPIRMLRIGGSESVRPIPVSAWRERLLRPVRMPADPRQSSESEMVSQIPIKGPEKGRPEPGPFQDDNREPTGARGSFSIRMTEGCGIGLLTLVGDDALSCPPRPCLAALLGGHGGRVRRGRGERLARCRSLPGRLPHRNVRLG